MCYIPIRQRVAPLDTDSTTDPFAGACVVHQDGLSASRCAAHAKGHAPAKGFFFGALTGEKAQASIGTIRPLVRAGGWNLTPQARRSLQREVDPDARGCGGQPHGASVVRTKQCVPFDGKLRGRPLLNMSCSGWASLALEPFSSKQKRKRQQ